MKREHATTQNRLCIARKALKAIARYKPDLYEDSTEALGMLKYYAEQALKDMLEVK